MANGQGSRTDRQRKAAKARGEDRYFTGRPCLRGHVSERVTSSGYCIECRREKDRIYYANNPDRVALKGKEYYAKNSELAKRKRREWYAKPENKEKAKLSRALYNEKNADYVAEYARQNAKRYRERFPEKSKQAVMDWWSRNPERKKTYHRNRRARKRGNGGSHTQAEINEIFKHQKGRCAYCRIKLGAATNERHVDHIVPLIEGGTNDRRNLQILCQPCNLEKGRRDPIDHARKLGMLL
jgi:5-methylcytosine-specific restriction endonuclease McrA